MARLTLAAALDAHHRLHSLFTRSPEAITLPRLVVYLNLLAHLERIDVKISRTARTYLDAGEGLTQEQRRVCVALGRDEEAMRKRRNTYIGWSFMLRRHYLNTLLITTHDLNPHAKLTPLLDSAVYTLFPPSDAEHTTAPAPLFVRNLQEGEQRVVDTTDMVYEEVVVWVDEQSDWRPTALPFAKPLPEILAAIGRYVASIERASRRMERAFARASSVADGAEKEGDDALLEGKDDERERGTTADRLPRQPEIKSIYPPVPSLALEETTAEHTIVLTTLPPRPAAPTSTATTKHRPAQHSDGVTSREKSKGKESRATKAVLAFFGDGSSGTDQPTEETTSARGGSEVDAEGSRDVKTERRRARREGSDARQGSSVSAGKAARRDRRRSAMDSQVAETDSEMNVAKPAKEETRRSLDHHGPEQLHPAELSTTTSPQTSNGRASPSRATPQRRRHRSSMPGYDILLRRVRERSRALSVTPGPERARSVSVAPERTRRASMGPREREPTPAPDVGTAVAWVPSPGSRFEVDGEGKLVFLGMAPVVTPTAQPQQRIESLRKVKEAAEATRTPGSGASPASSRREFIKPLPRALGNGNARSQTEGNAMAGPSRIPVRTTHTTSAPKMQQQPITTFAPPNGSSSHETPTPTTSSRKRPAPFEDSTVQRVPPQYRTAERRLSTSRVAVDFSRAQREGRGTR